METYLYRTGKLDKFKNFILVLIKLRLNLDFKLLGYMLGVSHVTISNNFYKTLFIMHAKLLVFVRWPTRLELQKNVPLAFRERYGLSITCIVDCFEIKCEKPKEFDTASSFWSSYKHNYPIKFLIAISSQGAIIFISKTFGGRASDKKIIQESGFLEHLQPGDTIMADRGFDVADTLSARNVKLQIPAFTFNKQHLHPLEVEKTRKLANVSIHVERVYGTIKQKYIIFDDCYPIHALSRNKNHDENAAVNQQMTLCCAFYNLCSPIFL